MSSLLDRAALRDPVSASTPTWDVDGAPQARAETATHSFGALLKHHRIQVGMSQETLAQDARLSTETISALERGSRRNPYRQTVALLAKALRLSPAERTLFELAARRPKMKRAPTSTRRSWRFTGVTPENLTTQLTALTGPIGIGKKRLAIAITAGLLTSPANSTSFADLAPLADTRLIASTAPDSLSSGFSSNAQPNAALRDLLAGKQLLLTVDNCEQLFAAIGALAKILLDDAPQRMLLVARRQACEIAGESICCE